MSHGSHATSNIVAPRSKFYQGPFGRICNNLTPWFPPGHDPAKDPKGLEKHLLDIANNEMVELLDDGKPVNPRDIATDRPTIDDLEARFGSKIPAGYTYFGQFVDHDITFDPASSLMRQNDPAGLLNHRTPRLDLDNVYGRGPADSPYLYDHDDKHKRADGSEHVDKFLIGRAIEKDSEGKAKKTDFGDLPRNCQGRALIGDMRNDENSMVSQLQLAFLRAHNTLAQRARDAGIEDSFEAARKTLRWLYQWIVWNDFIRRIAHDEIYKTALRKHSATSIGPNTWQLGLKNVYNWKHQPFMPVEFSVAAYRFGHSMVRNSYQTNHPHRGFGNFTPIFDNTGGSAAPDDLRGFRPMETKNMIQWDWFLEMDSSQGEFPQRARKIDTKLANALVFLHEAAPGSPLNVLAFRNLLRSVRMELPSGSSVAKKWCIDPIDIEPSHDALWFYILKEAEGPHGKHGQMLGRVGSTIVCATFAGLLLGDPCSYFNIEPCWEPDQDPLLKPGVDNKDDDQWSLTSIIRLSGLKGDASDF